MAHDWDLKWLHRLLVTSGAYRMAAAGPKASHERDPDNRWLWRMGARRLEAEALRDGLLHLAGALDRRAGGPPLDCEQDAAPARRSVYFRYSREDKLPFLAAFDPAGVEECYCRQESVVPQQALTMEGPFAADAARRIARRLGAVAPATFVCRAFELLLARPPTREERAACVAFLRELSAHRGPAFGEEAAWRRAREQLVLALLNHHDFLTAR
jgi:hypothetical protein